MRGQDQEMLEPELRETEQHDTLELEDAKPAIEGTAETVDASYDPLTSDPSLHFSATAEPEQPSISTEPKRHYNIHMPTEVPEAAAQSVKTKAPETIAPVQVTPAPQPIQKPQPIYQAPEEPLEEGVERSKQLNATIEQLEHAAMDEDDLAEQTQAEAHHSQAAYQEYMQEQPTEQELYQTHEPEISAELVYPEPVYQEPASQEPVYQEPTPQTTEHQEPSFTSDPEPEVIPEPMFIEPTTADEPLHHNQAHEEFEPAFAQDAPVADETPWEEPSTPAELMEPQTQSHNNEQAIDLPWEEVTEEEPTHPDQDVAAFQNIVSEAQANMAAAQNPFLVQKEPNLPKPTSPMPTLELLYHPEKRDNFIDRDALEEIARLVESKLADYKIKAEVVDIFPGPVITRFELDLAPGVKVSRISSLSMDLARSLSAMAVRVVEVIPGKPYVGLELPNMSRQTVFFSDVVGSQQFIEAKSPTTVVMGQDIAGEAVIADIAKMPHVLVAGTTGSGKSVGVNVMILSMLYKATPEDLRFIMIDPKMLELSIYEGIPHLLSEVVTDMKDASNALRWCVGEMERRYKLMSALGVRNIKGYNDKLKMAAEAGHPIHDPLWQPGDSMDPEPPLLEKLPYIVVVVDEFADLMMVVGKKVEELIARLAQKARAAGIHLILATQRPSVDVITGLIKANIPTRVAFTVSTKTDSRTILDQGGAESLLGMGDMLYLPPGSSHTIRVHGAFASDDDVHAVVNDWKARGKPNYIDEITNGEQTPETLLPGEKMEGDEDVDPLFDQVVEHVVQSRRGSVSGVQRRFKIGYNRAARIVEQLEAQGIVSPPGHNGNREVLAPAPPKE